MKEIKIWHIEPRSPALQPDSLLSDPPGKPHNGTLFSLKKGNPAIFNDMAGPGEHYIKWNKPDLEIHILYSLT